MADPVLAWLLEGDPAIRWQLMRDVLCKPARTWSAERKRVLEEGWGARLLSRRRDTGHWDRGPYTPKWTSTTYTLLEFRHLGPVPGNPCLSDACRLLLDLGVYRDGGINLWAKWRKSSETCVTGMALSVSAALGLRDERLEGLAQHLLREQMPDGGWNCLKYRGATHSSFHTTISALEGLRDYAATAPPCVKELEAAEARGREFFLRHSLYRSHRTGRVFDDRMTRFTFPPRWHYDVLRGLDYFRESGAERDGRLADAIALVESRRSPDGRWTLPAPWRGSMHIEFEQQGEPSRWNTLRALRVLRWWGGEGGTRGSRPVRRSSA